jgi:hypothetical protein
MKILTPWWDRRSKVSFIWNCYDSILAKKCKMLASVSIRKGNKKWSLLKCSHLFCFLLSYWDALSSPFKQVLLTTTFHLQSKIIFLWFHIFIFFHLHKHPELLHYNFQFENLNILYLSFCSYFLNFGFTIFVAKYLILLPNIYLGTPILISTEKLETWKNCRIISLPG